MADCASSGDEGLAASQPQNTTHPAVEPGGSLETDPVSANSAKSMLSLGRPGFRSETRGREVHKATSEAALRPRVLILSEIRFVREALAEILGRESSLSVGGVTADHNEACAVCQASRITVVIIDSNLTDGLATVDRIKASAPDAHVLVVGVAETSENVIAWAEAGATGYVPRSASLAELVEAVSRVMRGEQLCTTRIAAGLLRRLANRRGTDTGPHLAAEATKLTAREIEIARLLAEGLSNKEVARRLGVAVSTSKSHVHNLLQKLSITRRGQVGPRLRRYQAGLPTSA
jgi:two-component system, NarL family, nitrate/nitrite response regulator NarL